jgi:hypothetical protein
MTIQVFGIRHHGSGSARSLLRALWDYAPDAILIEGPPDAQAVLALAGAEDMQPPVALLVYASDDLRHAVYYPLAVFSPEWQAMRYGLTKAVTVRFIDLPQSYQMALDLAAADPATLMRTDPLGELAKAAGYQDGERWWEHLVEQRQDSAGVFEAILEAMGVLREEERLPDQHIDLIREAHMRTAIRAAQREGWQRIAVVCGAYHAPVLTETRLHQKGSAAADEALLKKLKKVKTEATWLPWTHGRLTLMSGYGAGIWSPGWYQHLWDHSEHIVETWLTRVAHLLRKEDLDASPAQVIDAVRLSAALAALRGRALPDLDELNEATRATLCFGDDAPMRLIHDQLIVGDTIGQVPDATPMVPLQRDLNHEQKRLRLKPEAGETPLALDLRKPTDLERSHLLHRLNLLGVAWGKKERVRRQAGTFNEAWKLLWSPEMTIRLIERSMWGSTVVDAATHFAQNAATTATKLPKLTELVHHALQANLPGALDGLIGRLQEVAALTGDVSQLMGSLPTLADVLTYGNVRQTDASMVGAVVDGLVTRTCIGLPGACVGLDEAAATPLFDLMISTNAALRLMRRADHLDQWTQALLKIIDLDSAHGLLRGRACRILLDGGELPVEEVARHLRLALTLAADPVQVAAWLLGFLKDSGAILIHDTRLLAIVDAWVTGLRPESFTAIVPLIRRTFTTFAAPERKQIGSLIKGNQRQRHADAAPLDNTRANAVLPILAELLGVPHHD